MARFKGLILPAALAAAFLCILSCPPPAEQVESSPPPRDGVFIHVSHGPADPQRVLMALNMAVLMSEDRDVAVYFDIEGIQAVLKDAPDLRMEPFPSSHIQIARLAEAGVPVMACPGCLKAAGKTADDIMEEVRVADKETFFSFTGGRILTLDY